MSMISRFLYYIIPAFLALLMVIPQTGSAAGEEKRIDAQEWSWTTLLGGFDRHDAQRGLQVYREICSACHALGYFYYRDLSGLGYSDNEIKAIAAQDQVRDGPDDEGEYFDRPARPSDRHAKPFENANAARAANGGAWPPNLLTTIRSEGPDYVYAILTRYKEAPDSVALSSGQYYNEAAQGNVIAMPPPIEEGTVEYSDGTKATLDRQARDVTTFLAWAGEPTLELRKKTGVKVMLFLFAFLIILILAKRRVWSDTQH